MAISMLKIRRPLGRLIFNMGIAIPGKTVFLIETAPGVAVCSSLEKCLSLDNCGKFRINQAAAETLDMDHLVLGGVLGLSGNGNYKYGQEHSHYIHEGI